MRKGFYKTCRIRLNGKVFRNLFFHPSEDKIITVIPKKQSRKLKRHKYVAAFVIHGPYERSCIIINNIPKNATRHLPYIISHEFIHLWLHKNINHETALNFDNLNPVLDEMFDY